MFSLGRVIEMTSRRGTPSHLDPAHLDGKKAHFSSAGQAFCALTML
jgi:hypothetical protein